MDTEITMQKPSLGRIVHFRPGENIDPGAAMITRVHTDTCVNLIVFEDGRDPRSVTSVTLRDEDNNEWGCWWPPRV